MISRNAKYIVVEGRYGETPIVFANAIEHAEMANSIGQKVISAGFVTIGRRRTPFEEGLVAKVEGESTSLGLRSRREDGVLITKMLRL